MQKNKILFPNKCIVLTWIYHNLKSDDPKMKEK